LGLPLCTDVLPALIYYIPKSGRVGGPQFEAHVHALENFKKKIEFIKFGQLRRKTLIYYCLREWQAGHYGKQPLVP